VLKSFQKKWDKRIAELGKEGALKKAGEVFKRLEAESEKALKKAPYCLHVLQTRAIAQRSMWESQLGRVRPDAIPKMIIREHPYPDAF
jgi:hypothetical protein